jgi:hypothetical protein
LPDSPGWWAQQDLNLRPRACGARGHSGGAGVYEHYVGVSRHPVPRTGAVVGLADALRALAVAGLDPAALLAATEALVRAARAGGVAADSGGAQGSAHRR